jgi:hypothetical protein
LAEGRKFPEDLAAKHAFENAHCFQFKIGRVLTSRDYIDLILDLLYAELFVPLDGLSYFVGSQQVVLRLQVLVMVFDDGAGALTVFQCILEFLFL